MIKKLAYITALAFLLIVTMGVNTGTAWASYNGGYDADCHCVSSNIYAQRSYGTSQYGSYGNYYNTNSYRGGYGRSTRQRYSTAYYDNSYGGTGYGYYDDSYSNGYNQYYGQSQYSYGSGYGYDSQYYGTSQYDPCGCGSSSYSYNGY